MARRRLKILALLAGIIMVAFLPLLANAQISREESLMAARAVEQIEGAMASDPVERWDRDDPLYYFRPKGHEETEDNGAVDAVAYRSSLKGDMGTVLFHVKRESRFPGRPPSVTRDKVKVIMEKADDGQWNVVDIDVRP